MSGIGEVSAFTAIPTGPKPMYLSVLQSQPPGISVPGGIKRRGSKRPTVKHLASVLKKHAKRLDGVETRLTTLVAPEEIKLLLKRVAEHDELPLQIQALKEEFYKLREDVTAPLGRLSLDHRAIMRVLINIADKQEVEVPEKLRERFKDA